MGNGAFIRICKDLVDYKTPSFITIKYIPNQLDMGIRIIPEEGLFKGRVCMFKITFPKEYPIYPPKVRTIDTIFHPNIDPKGLVCVNILGVEWNPVYNLEKIISGIVFLLKEPYTDDSLNKFAADLMENDYDAYIRSHSIAIDGGIINGVKYSKLLIK